MVSSDSILSTIVDLIASFIIHSVSPGLADTPITPVTEGTSLSFRASASVVFLSLPLAPMIVYIGSPSCVYQCPDSEVCLSVIFSTLLHLHLGLGHEIYNQGFYVCI